MVNYHKNCLSHTLHDRMQHILVSFHIHSYNLIPLLPLSGISDLKIKQAKLKPSLLKTQTKLRLRQSLFCSETPLLFLLEINFFMHIHIVICKLICNRSYSTYYTVFKCIKNITDQKAASCLFLIVSLLKMKFTGPTVNCS